MTGARQPFSGVVPGHLATFSPTADFVANWSGAQQTMDGFGASDRNNGTLTSGQLDLAFSTTSGIGLSLLRCSFEGTGAYESGSVPANAQGAVSRGASVWAAPWTAPNASKDNGSNIGGHLLSASYGSWSDAFVTLLSVNAIEPDDAVGMANHKRSVGAVTVQPSAPNEPPSCVPVLLPRSESSRW